MFTRILGVLSILYILHVWVIISGGKFSILFPYLFFPCLFMALAFCVLNVCKVPQGNRKLLFLWVLISTLPVIALIHMIKFIGRHSFYPWYVGLWDFAIPLGIIGAQFVFWLWMKHRSER